MTPKERLIKTLLHEPVDRRPFICPGGMMTMIIGDVMDASGSAWPEAHSDAEKMATLTLAAHRLAGVENVGVPFCMTVEAEAMGATIDLGTKESEPKVIAYAIARMEEIDRIAGIDVEKGRTRVCVEAIKILRGQAPGVPIIGNLTGPISLAASLIDPLLFYRAMLKNKSAAHGLVEKVTDDLIVFGRAMMLAGADIICIADPSATGEIIGRHGFEEFAVPYINSIVARLREEFRALSIVHICGNVRTLKTGLARTSGDAISIDSVVAMDRLKEMIGDRVAMGNISTHLLERGSPDAVFRAALAAVKRGADIVAPACGISPRTPVENVRALLRAAISAGKEDR